MTETFPYLEIGLAKIEKRKELILECEGSEAKAIALTKRIDIFPTLLHNCVDARRWNPKKKCKCCAWASLFDANELANTSLGVFVYGQWFEYICKPHIEKDFVGGGPYDEFCFFDWNTGEVRSPISYEKRFRPYNYKITPASGAFQLLAETMKRIVFWSPSGIDTIKIYALLDPFDGRVRYIGKSQDVERRFSSHIGDADKIGKKAEWIGDCIFRGKQPIMKTLEEVTGPIWRERERFWISFYRDQFPDLLNISEGG